MPLPGEPDGPLPRTMTTAEEMRALAESIRMAHPYQAARLHVLATQVEGGQPARRNPGPAGLGDPA